MSSKRVRAAMIVEKSGVPVGAEHTAVVLKIESKDALGRAKSAVLYYDDEKIAIQGGEEFLIVYVRSDCIAPVTRGDA